jgi:uncharacterized membrane protein YeaQ/YmgE (transglycosylase-associated protein family)
MGGIIAALFSGFLIGAAARWIVPGPDPMPAWLTVGLGLAGSLAGGGIAAALFGTSHVMTTSGNVFVTLLLEIGIATALVIAYRRFVQQRSIVGPDAHRFPTRGVGIARLRARLQQVGIDPEKLSSGPITLERPPLQPETNADPVAEPDTPAEEPAEEPDELETLRDLHAKGILTDEEFEAARHRLGNE